MPSNACEQSDCSPSADCTAKTATTFECKCKEGFWGNGYQCTDNNECMKPELAGCSSLATCKNSIGSYDCTCNSGQCLIYDH